MRADAAAARPGAEAGSRIHAFVYNGVAALYPASMVSGGGSGGQEAPAWDAERVQRLRAHLRETQGQFAVRLGTRQQTVSEWERGASRPRGMSRRLLQLVAEEAGFYRTPREQRDGPAAGQRPELPGAAPDAPQARP